MESFPESWIMSPLDGPSAYENMDYVLQETPEDAKAPHLKCLLCDTGHIKSKKSWNKHCAGRRHQRNYEQLEQQQLAWLQEEQVPETFIDPYLDKDQDIMDYFMPFRRWHFGKWEVGLSCQLCGTAAFPNRRAIIQHCETSRRHGILRSRTLWTNYHPEIHDNLHFKDRLSNLPPMYRWHVERSLLHYLASKERAMSSIQSRRYEWYNVWKTLHQYELRFQMSLLECAIWKMNLLDFDETSSFSSMSDLHDFLDERSIDKTEYRRARRKTSPSTAMILGVIPFLKTEPNPLGGRLIG